MLKILGSILIISGTFAWGYMKCTNAKDRIVQLNIIKKVMIMLRGEIKYAGTALPDALESISNRITMIFAKEFFINVSKELNEMSEKTFKTIWYENANKYLKTSALNISDLDQFKNLGDNLGYLDKDMHLNTIDLYLEHLNMDINLANEEIAQKCRVYKTVSLAAGVFITIIII